MLEPMSADQAADRILQLSSAITGDHVFTLRAELEGVRYTDAIVRLLTGWKNRGYDLVSLRDIASTLETKLLPRHCVEFAEMPGRPGKRMIQGPIFLQT